MDYVYLVTFKWSVEDDCGIGIKVFKTYQDARDYFDKLIEDEKNPDISWIGEEVFNEDGEVNEYFSLHSSISGNADSRQYWHVYDDIYGFRYSEIDLFKEPIIKGKNGNV